MLSHTIDGTRVRRRRERCGMSVADLAAGAEISSGMVYKIEQGRKQPGARAAVAMADTLGVDLDDLCVQPQDASAGVAEQQ